MNRRDLMPPEAIGALAVTLGSLALLFFLDWRAGLMALLGVVIVFGLLLMFPLDYRD